MHNTNPGSGRSASNAGPNGATPLDALFERIVIVNLATRRDRYDEMLGELEAVGVASTSRAVHRFEAVRPSDAGAFPNVGTRGCFMSHLAVLEESLAAGVQSLLILEDDCSFIQGFNERMNGIRAQLATIDWALLHGGSEQGEQFLTNGLREWQPAEHLQLAHFMAMRGRALQRLPSYLRRMLDRSAGDPLGGPMHVDGAYSWFRASEPELRCFVAAPRVAYQRSSRTDIHELSWRDRLPIVREAVSLARRVKNRVDRAH